MVGDDGADDDDDDEPVQREPEQSTRNMAKVQSHASFERDSITLGYRTGSISSTILDNCFLDCVGARTASGRGARCRRDAYDGAVTAYAWLADSSGAPTTVIDRRTCLTAVWATTNN